MYISRLVALIAWMICAATLHAGQIVVVVLDDSGSMGDRMRSNPGTTKMAAAKTALVQILQQLPEDAQVGVILLNGTVNNDSWVVPLGPVDQASMSATMASLQASGGTPLGAFMKSGADALLAKRDKERYGTYRLLIVTDGEANDGNLVDQYLPNILARGLSVDVIGVDMAENHSLATRVNTYRSADDPASLTRAISEVFAESVDNNADTAESDFEIIQALPDEVAATVLSLLATVGNAPIGTQASVVSGSAPSGDTGGANRGFPPPNARTVPSVPPRQRPDKPRVSWFVYVVIFIILLQVVKVFKRLRR